MLIKRLVSLRNLFDKCSVLLPDLVTFLPNSVKNVRDFSEKSLIFAVFRDRFPFSRPHLEGAAMRFELEQSDGTLTSHSGLALIGLLLEETQLRTRLNQTVVSACPNPDIPHADVVTSYLGLLVQGKSDFEDIEPFREDVFFCTRSGLRTRPFCAHTTTTF